jgi:hypothetical protein
MQREDTHPLAQNRKIGIWHLLSSKDVIIEADGEEYYLGGKQADRFQTTGV